MLIISPRLGVLDWWGLGEVGEKARDQLGVIPETFGCMRENDMGVSRSSLLRPSPSLALALTLITYDFVCECGRNWTMTSCAVRSFYLGFYYAMSTA
jgi:hypothetical protein